MKTYFTCILVFAFTIVWGQNNCSNAVTILLNSTTTAPSFSGETGTTAPTPLCGLSGGNGSKGKWYKFSATQNLNVTISTQLPQNNDADTRVIVYTGTCAALVCVNSNDDYKERNC